MPSNGHSRNPSALGLNLNGSIPQQHQQGSSRSEDTSIPEKWLPGQPIQYPVPKPSDDPWEACHKLVDKYDDDICKAWKDEIDKLLIFAGLFSATVTAFAVESYQWLEDPRDTNTDLLAQLVALQQNAGTPTISNNSNFNLPPFSASQSAIRINVFWFLSLILALSSVLVGILCLQWLREYQRPVSMSFKDSLICRQIRYDGLTAWKVPSIISFLPLILQLSLVLFFAGVLDLLWNRDQLVGIVIAIPIAIATLFLIITTILPMMQNLVFMVSKDRPPPSQCPYKSPQSWLFHRFTSVVLTFKTWRLYRSMSRDTDAWIGWGHSLPLDSFLDSTWFGFDRRWNWPHFEPSISSNFMNFHAIHALQWIQTNFGHHASIFYNLYHCRSELDGMSLMRLTNKSDEQKALHVNNEKGLFGVNVEHLDVEGADMEAIIEMAQVIYLNQAPEVLKDAVWPYLLQHWMKAVNNNPGLAQQTPEMLTVSVRDMVGPSGDDEFFVQRLLCCLSILRSTPSTISPRTISQIWQVIRIQRPEGSPHLPVADLLIQRILSRIKKWLLDGVNLDTELASQAQLRPQLLPADIEERIKVCAFGIHKLCWSMNRIPPCALKAVFADLAWMVNSLANILKPPIPSNTPTVVVGSSGLPVPTRARQLNSTNGLPSTGPRTLGGPPALKSFLSLGLREDHWLQLFQVSSLNTSNSDRTGTAKDLWFKDYLINMGYNDADGDDLDGEGNINITGT